jgi:hypothetical protein
MNLFIWARLAKIAKVGVPPSPGLLKSWGWEEIFVMVFDSKRLTAKVFEDK